jgi:hypothetical protein
MKFPFNDPAIMSASVGVALAENGYATYAAPPGLTLPPGLAHSATMNDSFRTSNIQGSTDGEFFTLKFKGREVSIPSAVLLQCGMYSIGCDEPSNLQLPVSRSFSHRIPIGEPSRCGDN